MRALLIPLFPPTPTTLGDDVSLLFQAATFAHLRLANPPPLSVLHVTPVFVVTAPHWVSQYQPGQALFLALGAWLGNPWVGVFLSTGILLICLWWALRGFFPAKWALIGLLIGIIQWGIFGPIMNTFHGGNVAAIGGALIVGALKPNRRHQALILGFGTIITASGRPLEAFVWGLISVAALFWQGNARRIGEYAATVLLGVAGLGFYNFKTTDSIATPPYIIHMKEFGTPQGAFFQSPLPPGLALHAPDLRAVYLHQRTLHSHARSAKLLLTDMGNRLWEGWLFFVGPLWTLPLFWLPGTIRRFRYLFLIAAIFIAEHACFHAWFAHHSSPELALYLILLTACVRSCSAFRIRAIPAGVIALRVSLVTGLICITFASLGKATEHLLPANISKLRAIWFCEYPSDNTRNAVEQQVLSRSSQALVFVNFDKPELFPWIANGPDLAAQRIIWARDLGSRQNASLIREFAQRTVWIMHTSDRKVSLVQPSGSQAPHIT